MKVILTGATGYIGSSVLLSLIRNSEISHIVVLIRKTLPASLTIDDTTQKVEQVIVKDWENYDEDVKKSWKGAEGCIWCQGLALPPTPEIAIFLALTYPKAFLDSYTTTYPEQKLRYIMLSGRYVEQDQDKKLWFLTEARKMRGRTETSLLTNSFSHPSTLTSFVVRPAAVTSQPFLSWLGGSGNAILNTVLGNAMVQIVLKGEQVTGGKRKVENEDLKVIGLQGLDKSKKGAWSMAESITTYSAKS